MPTKYKKLAKEWFLRASDDELAIHALLNEKGPPNIVCFLAQQMVEKYLKGYLVYRGERFPKIHQLDRLLKLCTELDHDFALFRESAEHLSGFYVSTRYPGDYPDFSLKQAKDAFEKALNIKEFVLNKIL